MCGVENALCETPGGLGWDQWGVESTQRGLKPCWGAVGSTVGTIVDGRGSIWEMFGPVFWGGLGKSLWGVGA